MTRTWKWEVTVTERQEGDKEGGCEGQCTGVEEESMAASFQNLITNPDRATTSGKCNH